MDIEKAFQKAYKWVVTDNISNAEKMEMNGHAVLLKRCLSQFVSFLGNRDIDVIDINWGSHSGTYHPLFMAIDIWLQSSKRTPVEIISLACEAGFTGVGVYRGKNVLSYHFDVAPRRSIWIARPAKVDQLGSVLEWEYFYIHQTIEEYFRNAKV